MALDKNDKKKIGTNIFLCILLIIVIVLYDRFNPFPEVGVVYICLAIGFFIFIREILCWYWKMNETVTLLNKQLSVMNEIESALKTQNKTLFTLLNNQNEEPAVKKQLEK